MVSRQESDFVLGDSRQESTLEPGFVRAPKDMKPPTPVEWGRGDSLMWDTRRPDDPPESTPLTGYGRDRDFFADVVATVSPTKDQNQPFPVPLAPGERKTTMSPGNAQPHPGLQHHPSTQSIGTHSSSSGGRPPMAPGSRQLTSNEISPQPTIRQFSSSVDLAQQFRTASQQLTDELYAQAISFPPPPPILAPAESRRQRAELWYYFAVKWDITHQQPPPPRSPLPFMDEELQFTPAQQQNAMNQFRYPYRGEYWMDRCNHWFDHVQNGFNWPPTSRVMALSKADVMDLCVTE